MKRKTCLLRLACVVAAATPFITVTQAQARVINLVCESKDNQSGKPLRYWIDDEAKTISWLVEPDAILPDIKRSLHTEKVEIGPELFRWGDQFGYTILDRHAGKVTTYMKDGTIIPATPWFCAAGSDPLPVL
ncbi:MAG TPA: hypothetical protein VJ476_05130 [Rhizomicrobium sp.]|nr:hypothetical protein [Rhizomicrobium sp.]